MAGPTPSGKGGINVRVPASIGGTETAPTYKAASYGARAKLAAPAKTPKTPDFKRGILKLKAGAFQVQYLDGELKAIGDRFLSTGNINAASDAPEAAVLIRIWTNPGKKPVSAFAQGPVKRS